MFSLVVQVQVRPDRREEFLAGMATNAEASVRDEPGCLRFDVCSVDGDETRFVLYELYADADAFAAHKAAPHFAEWRTVAERVLEGQVTTRGSLLVTLASEECASARNRTRARWSCSPSRSSSATAAAARSPPR